LIYKPYSDRGDQIIDFSFCGYQKSELPLPNVPVTVTLEAPNSEVAASGNMKYPVGHDSFATIQAALNEVAAMEPDANGHRGAVLLQQGHWYLSGALLIRSGVVLRGEGSGENGTTLIFTPSNTGSVGIQIGEAGGGSTINGTAEITGIVSEIVLENGKPGYLFTMDDGNTFRVHTPRAQAGFSYDEILNERVTLTFSTQITSLGGETHTQLHKTYPESFKHSPSDQAAATLPSDLILPVEQETNATASSAIADTYTPSGSRLLTLENTTGFKVGDHINVAKTTNEAWIERLGVGERLRHIRGGKEGAFKKPWGLQNYSHPRQITAISGNTITLDVPLPQSFDPAHGGGNVSLWKPKTTSMQSGVESLRVISNYDTQVVDTGKEADFGNLKNGVQVNGRHSWVRDVLVKHVWLSAVKVEGSQFITVRDCQSLEPVGPKRGGRYYTYSIGGSMGVLFYKCTSEEGRHDFVVNARTPGPNAFVDCTARRGGTSEPHARWGVGTLYDNVTKLEGGKLGAFNRGDSGSGHGWAGANTVFWNCNADSITVFDPETEGENNFAIGFTGQVKESYDTNSLYYANTRAGYWGTPNEGKYYGFAIVGNGHIESPLAAVEPRSLFKQQLIDRIGETRAKKIIH